MHRLEKKVAIITGGGSGIGRATALLFAQHGAKIVVSDIKKDLLDETVEILETTGTDVIPVESDITNEDDVKNIIHSAISEFKAINILVNSAGVTPRYAPDDWSFEKKWDWVIDVNLKGTVMMSKYVSEIMLSNGHGSILNLSSIIGLVGYAEGLSDGFNPYPHSKGGVVQFTKDMAVKFAKSNIRIK